ncbi:dicarboxylate/amino acid:cation symporter [Reichenbachiella carrageenanivorans]|uniref:Dicarboxylate/amino acid:cation symporter n=1 Tax=Reichenbachiella carrageenanivorans TaxID=2979869 RepID=A0ABY6D177_9BACT|nr:dicarboxylate/amino acid:cation symporter [Reichenbachiella carrageenanivorans]UXX79868.1 dicarboxylate/amino acid:cation symporter [Reichenbachiella carrageenanivorans]
MRKLPLHIKIILGLALGLLFGVLSIICQWPPEFTIYYIKPFGTLFVNALKMIAVPLVLASLIVGVSNLGDISKLSRMGAKTIGLYLATTVLATSLGMLAVNVMKPGEKLSVETRDDLMSLYAKEVEKKADSASELKSEGPLQPIVKLIPTNIISAASDNKMMLQIVLFAIAAGIALLEVPKKKGTPVIAFFDGLNDIIIKLVHYIMQVAPYCVFALIASLIVELAGTDAAKAFDLLYALMWYVTTVLLGLGAMILLVYPSVLMVFTKIKYADFFRGIRPAQLLAFSTSSSSATLPVTMDCLEQNLKVPEEVASFVLPLGATINMDGTSLYQSVAAVFIAQALGMELSIGSQLMIVLTATLASVGSAGVPGAGMVMLVIVLESIGVPAAGIALIVAPDRLLDMCRTTVNVTGDATVTMVVAHAEQPKSI